MLVLIVYCSHLDTCKFCIQVAFIPIFFLAISPTCRRMDENRIRESCIIKVQCIGKGRLELSASEVSQLDWMEYIKNERALIAL